MEIREMIANLEDRRSKLTIAIDALKGLDGESGSGVSPLAGTDLSLDEPTAFAFTPDRKPRRKAKKSPAAMPLKRAGRTRPWKRFCSVDGEGRFTIAEAAAKLGVTPDGIRHALKHSGVCREHKVVDVTGTSDKEGE